MNVSSMSRNCRRRNQVATNTLRGPPSSLDRNVAYASNLLKMWQKRRPFRHSNSGMDDVPTASQQSQSELGVTMRIIQSPTTEEIEDYHLYMDELNAMQGQHLAEWRLLSVFEFATLLLIFWSLLRVVPPNNCRRILDSHSGCICNCHLEGTS